MMSLRFFRRAALAIATIAGLPAIVFGTSLIAATTAEAAALTSIQVSGNDRIDSATIRSYVPVPIGRNFGQAELNQTLGILFATGFFANVQVTGSGGTMYIAVVENPVVVDIVYDGNRKVRDPEMREITETQIRGVLSDVVLAADIRRIEERYAQIGRGAAVVDVEVQPLDGNLAVVIFRVTEGDRVRIADISFEGNEAFSDRQLKSVIATSESSILTLINKADAYSDDGLAGDIELLRRHYLQNGYADFQVTGTNVVYDEIELEYTIVIGVSEGPRYAFGAIGVDSTILDVDGDTLARAIHTRSGQVFNALDLERSLEDITVALVDAGYPFAAVTPRANRNYSTNEIDITYRVDPGARVYIERIEIVGNTRTREYVIRREFAEAEGDAFNRVLVSRVERRLQSLGIFDNVYIEVQQGSAPDLAVLVVHVTESSTGEWSFTGGYSSVDGVVAEVSLNETNFLGRGQHLRLSFAIGASNRSYSMSFTEPMFLGRRISMGFDIYRRASSGGAGQPYAETTDGGQLRLGVPLTGRLTAQIAYRFSQNVVSASTRPDVYPDGLSVTSAVGLTVVYNTIGDMADPRQGISVRVGVDYAGLGGTVSFVRGTADARWYRPLGYRSPVVAMLRFQGGHISGIGSGVRMFDTFSGSLIRGFASSGYGPRTGAPSELALGGKTYWATTAELTAPVPFISDQIGLRVGVFADAGMLFGIDDPGGIGDGIVGGADTTLRASAGVSLLWSSPIGPLRFDYAWILSGAIYDIPQAFRFSVGGEF
ncbi:MAG: outer membrane protein assembly factor BamA [Alphaproteobacteria bacterium]